MKENIREEALLELRAKGVGEGLHNGVVARGAAVDANWDGFETVIHSSPASIEPSVI